MFFHLTNNMCLQCGESSVNQIASMNENDSLKRFVQNSDSFTRSLDGTLFYQKKIYIYFPSVHVNISVMLCTFIQV